MAIALVQSQKAQANAASVTATYDGATTSGNTLIAFVYTNSGTATLAISGWTSRLTLAYSGTAQQIAIFDKIASGSETTVQATGGNTITRIHIAEFSGMAATITTDGSNTNTASAVTTISTNSVATSNASDLLLTCAGTSTGEAGTRSWDSSFNTLQDDATSPRLFSGYRIVSATGTYSSTATVGTTATNSGAFVIAYQGDAGTTTSTSSTSTSVSTTSTSISTTSSSTSTSSTSTSISTSSTSTSSTSTSTSSTSHSTSSTSTSLTSTSTSSTSSSISTSSTSSSTSSTSSSISTSTTTVINAPRPPTNLVATLNGSTVDLMWVDNSDSETGFVLQRSRGKSTSYYTIGTVSPGVTTYNDATVSAGYTYKYRVDATNNFGISNWTYSNTVTIPGTKTWSAYIMAWIYPGSPTETAAAEFSDGRRIHFLKPEYFTLATNGDLVLRTVASDGVNGYSLDNIAAVKSHSTYQFATVSAGQAALATFLATTSAHRNAAITTLVNFCVDNGITGIELDWEGYSHWTDGQYAGYKQFCIDLGTQLHANNKKLMINGPPIGDTSVYSDLAQSFYKWKYEDFETITEVDYIVVLAYDYEFDFGGGESVQPTRWVQFIMQWVRSKISDANRIVIGMPSYGYHATTGGFDVTIDTKAQSSALTGYSTATRNSDYEMTWTNAGSSFVYQDTPGMNLKRELIEDEGTKYVSVWHLGGNDWFSGKQELQLDVTTTSTSSSISTSSTSTSVSTSTSSTSSSVSTSSTSASTSISTSSTSSSISTSSTSTSQSTSTSSTSSSVSTSISTSSTSTSTTVSFTTSTSSTSSSISTSSTSRSISTSSTSSSISTSSTSSSISVSTSSTSQSVSTSTSVSTTSTSTSRSTSTSSTSTSVSTSTSTSTSSTSVSTSSTSTSTSSTTTLVPDHRYVHRVTITNRL